MKKSLLITLILELALFFFSYRVLLSLRFLLHPIVIVVVLFCFFILLFFLVLLVRQERIHVPYSLFMVLLYLYTMSLLILLFFRPNDQSYNSVNLIPFSTISFYLSGKVSMLISFYNLAANIGLFIPYGIYLRLNNVSIRKMIYSPVLAIVSIELLQFFTHRGSLDIDDLLLNLLGVYLGCLFYPLFHRIINVNPSAYK